MTQATTAKRNDKIRKEIRELLTHLIPHVSREQGLKIIRINTYLLSKEWL